MENRKKQPIMLSIAGSDSSAGAGIQADIKSAAAANVFCATAITSITAQNGVGVDAIFNLSADQVRAQIDAVMSDMNVVALKIGMLPTCDIVVEVCNAIKKYNIKNVVVDPVMISTSGFTLVDDITAQYIIKNLLPLASILTPNIPEVEFITGKKINVVSDFESTIDVLKELKTKAVLLKAGHLNSETLTDVLYDFRNDTHFEFVYQKIDSLNTHGTGCSLSSYIAAFLTKGDDLTVAVDHAEVLLHRAIEDSKSIYWSEGHGPLKHFK